MHAAHWERKKNRSVFTGKQRVHSPTKRRKKRGGEHTGFIDPNSATKELAERRKRRTRERDRLALPAQSAASSSTSCRRFRFLYIVARARSSSPSSSSSPPFFSLGLCTCKYEKFGVANTGIVTFTFLALCRGLTVTPLLFFCHRCTLCNRSLGLP